MWSGVHDHETKHLQRRKGGYCELNYNVDSTRLRMGDTFDTVKSKFGRSSARIVDWVCRGRERDEMVVNLWLTC